MGLAVVAPRVAALCAPIELGCRLINAARLDLPPGRLVVPAFRAFRLSLRRRAEVLLLLADYDDLILTLYLALYLYRLGHGLLGAALGAYVAPLLVVEGAHCPAFRAKLRFLLLHQQPLTPTGSINTLCI